MTETETIEREATSIKVKPDLWKDAKIEAIRHGKTVSELVEEAIEEWMKKHGRGGKISDRTNRRQALLGGILQDKA
jgi:hypothetical protein